MVSGAMIAIVWIVASAVEVALYRRRALYLLFLHSRLTRSHAFKDIVMPTWHTYSAHNKRAEKENLNPLIRHKYSTFTIWVARREMY